MSVRYRVTVFHDVSCGCQGNLVYTPDPDMPHGIEHTFSDEGAARAALDRLLDNPKARGHWLTKETEQVLSHDGAESVYDFEKFPDLD